MVESPWTVSSLQKIGEVHLLVFAYLKRSPHCAKHYKLEVPSQNKRMYGVVKVHQLGTIWISQIYLHFFNNKVKRKKHLLDISWNNGNNSIRKWWYCLAIRKKNLRTVARDIVSTCGVYGNWAYTKHCKEESLDAWRRAQCQEDNKDIVSHNIESRKRLKINMLLQFVSWYYWKSFILAKYSRQKILEIS